MIQNASYSSAMILADLGFRDLFFLNKILLDKDEIFIDFKVYRIIYCEQSIEKLLKSLLLQFEKNLNDTDLKKYSHNLMKIIEKIMCYLNEEQKEYAYNYFSKVGLFFFNSFGDSKKNLNLNYNKCKKFNRDLIKNYGNELNYFALFLTYLESGFIEIRYPCTAPFEEQVYQSNDSIPLAYYNNGIIDATILTCSIVMHFIEQDVQNFLMERYTWEKVCYSYEEPAQKIIEDYKASEILLREICTSPETLLMKRLKSFSC